MATSGDMTGALALFSFLTLHLLTSRPATSSTPCGGYISDSKGYIHTPNFPKPYQVPIQCQWVFEAPPHHKVSIYFTQFYMKRGVTAAEFNHYWQRVQAGVGRHEFGVITSDNEPTYLVSNLQVLVLTLNVRSLDNVHLRVQEHILDVSGFNITYEMLPRNDSVRADPCIYHHCSFNGHCYAEADFAKYACKCFGSYFGEECQFDDACGPTSTTQVCHNGGTCRYYVGSSVRTCECLPGYFGAQCKGELPAADSALETNETEKNCHHPQYSSPQGYISVYPKREKCLQEGSLQILSLEVSEALPVNEGAALLVACIVQSGREANVTWLKDGFPVVVQASQGRIWTMQVPKDSAGRSSFLLGFDKVNEHDIGSLTCNALDGERTEQLSVMLMVKLRSNLLMEPLALTVAVGSTFGITCVSTDGLLESSRYRWLKNGADLDGEKVEDLYPGGSRLILRKVLFSANYTCLMWTAAGIVRQDSLITVVSGTDFNSNICPQERKYEIGWKTTAANAVDIQKCPTGYTGFMKRRCSAGLSGKVRWEEPDFSTCFSPPVLAMKKELDSWKMGYRKKTANALLGELHDFLSNKSAEMHSSEGEPVVDMIFEADVSTTSQEDFEITWELLLNSVSILFHSNIVQKHQQKVKLQLLLRRIAVAYGKLKRFQNSLFFQTACLRVDYFKMRAGSPAFRQLPWCSTNESTCRNLSLSLAMKSMDQLNAYGNTTFTIVTVIYKCLHIGDLDDTYTSHGHLKPLFPTFSIDAISVGDVPEIETVLKPFSILSLGTDFSAQCMKIQVQNKNLSTTPCQLVTSSEKGVFCKCNGSGLFSVIARTQLSSKTVSTEYFHSKVCFITGIIIALFIIVQNIWKISWRLKMKIFLLT